MKPDYRITPAAANDLDDQALYLAEQAGIEIALRFYDAAAMSFATLARMPAMGLRRQTVSNGLDNVRRWQIEEFEHHLIFYRSLKEGVEIIRVLHSSRDLSDFIET